MLDRQTKNVLLLVRRRLVEIQRDADDQGNHTISAKAWALHKTVADFIKEREAAPPEKPHSHE
jgi:hypothetical protein